MKAILTAILFSIIMVIKKVFALLMYPIAYLMKDWIYEGSVVKNYHIPKKAKENCIAWFFWLFLDDDQPTGFPEWYMPELKYDFLRAYAWSAWRNPAYNINYNYFGNQSPIVSHKIWFGDYAWDRKLRASNGDNGIQWVWFETQKGQKRFLFSAASTNVPLTMYYGWNADYNGRFTVAFKFK